MEFEPIIINQCAWCKEFLDEQSKFIYEHRETTKFLISHGICENCEYQLNN